MKVIIDNGKEKIIHIAACPHGYRLKEISLSRGDFEQLSKLSPQQLKEWAGSWLVRFSFQPEE